MGRILVILEVSRKQDYIFASKELKQNAQRSAQITYVTSSAFFTEAAGDLYCEENNLVYAGGGHTVLQFTDEQQAYTFVQRVTHRAMCDFDGIELFAKQMRYDLEKTPGENLKELSRQLEKKKALRQASFRRTSFGMELLNRETFHPEAIGAERPAATVSLQNDEKYPTKFSELAGEDNFIAVVHIDGNAMGRRVDCIYQDAGMDWADCCGKLRRFSAAIQCDFEAAFAHTVDMLRKQGCERNGILPIRPVILAGDDVCFVTAGSLGLECARIFIDQLTTMRNAEDEARYAACAGVALVHQKYPFHQAYQLSEELCSSAKAFGARFDSNGGVSAMDWHIEFGQLKGGLQQIRQEYITEDGNRLSLRPVVVTAQPEVEEQASFRTYAFFRALCSAMKSEYGRTARGKIKDLRTAFKQGEVESRFFFRQKEVQHLLRHSFDAQYQDEARWKQFRKILKKKAAIEKEPFRALCIAGETDTYCLYFDAIEMIDHFTVAEEEVQCKNV